ncbi:phosphoinositide phosphatase SAC5-like [Brassica napus]|uniref:phosphoinositide phosphatase SAC5-like n=1 Tax=Brassica napus TaxID=3708 RepID=UPI00207AF1F5|nr:phosphoinositide phosphatase SAC5-like [Brassica napus]
MLKLVDLPVLHKFTLYRTRTNYYLIGRDEKKTFWRILKIDRTDPNELNLFEDPTRYTHDEITQLKKWISRGNQKYGGLRAETTCYGIIGFVKFLGPYYMLVIKRRKKVGEICGHTVYGVAESQMIMIPYPSRKTIDADSSAERKYKKLLNMVDLSKDFYFSYTYHLMYSLQKNICNTERGKIHDETMFVWNEYLTHGIRRNLRNTVWTVALVYGFFQQTKCLVSDEQFILTVIARRSRHYAGTRYLRRGVNEEGSVANEVETEQIVTKEVPEGQKIPMTSVVQMRGSIPLFWSQKPSVFNPQPNIILNNKDRNYVATKLHFENLKQRYGKLIIILNLLKAGKHRENILREEFEKAILFINGGTRRENHLKANHFDLNEHYKSGADRAFKLLCADGKEALESINLFFGEVPSGIGADLVINDTFFNSPILNQDEEATSSEQEALKADIFMRQTGVFRSNCIDCLDRTNVAQFAYGLVALARQLQKLGIRGPPIVDKNNPLAKKLMEVYENMGDAIAMQYAGSDAHIKMFSALRGDWNIIKKNRDKIIALRRHLYNTFQDSEKQNAINVFLGEFKPQLGKPALWELPSDQRNTMRNSSNLNINKLRPNHSRSFSDNLILESLDPKELVQENHQPSRAGLNSGWETTSNGGWETTSNGGWETTSEVGFCEAEPSSSRVHSVIRDEDNLRGIGSRQMFLEVGSTSDSHGLEDAPGLSHSYNATFITAEEMFERCSSTSSDLIIEVFSFITISVLSIEVTFFFLFFLVIMLKY